MEGLTRTEQQRLSVERSKSRRKKIQIFEDKTGKKLIGTKEMCEKFFASPNELTKFAGLGMRRYRIEGQYYYVLEDCQKWWRGE